MFCPHCRTALPDRSKFCLSCGKPLPAAPAVAQPNPAAPPAGRPPVAPASPAGNRTLAPGEAPGTARTQSMGAGAPPRPVPPAQWAAPTAERPAMPAAPASRPPTPQETDSRPRLAPVIGAALLALLLVGGGGVWLLHRSQGASGSVATVSAPETGDARSIGAPSAPGLQIPAAGPSVVGGPGARGGPGLPNAAPGAGGPSVAGTPGGRAPGGPAVVGTPPGNGGPSVAGAPGGPRTGPGVIAAPPGPRGPSVVQAPFGATGGPGVTAAQGNPKTGPSVVNSPASPNTGPAVAKAPAATPSGPAVTAQPPAPRQPVQPQGMPPNILAYLDLVRRAENDRHRYEDRLSNMLMGLIPSLMMPNFEDDKVQRLDPQMVRMYDQIAREYAVGTQRFQMMAGRVGVPADCRVLHLNYSYALSRNPVLITETARRLVGGDYAGLHRMLTTVGRDLDEKYSAADSELNRLCGEYNVRKSFTIGDNGGGGGGSILGF